MSRPFATIDETLTLGTRTIAMRSYSPETE